LDAALVTGFAEAVVADFVLPGALDFAVLDAEVVMVGW